MSDGGTGQGEAQTRALLAFGGLLGSLIVSLLLSKLTVVALGAVWREPTGLELRFLSTILVFGWLGIIYFVLERAMKSRLGGQSLAAWFNRAQAEWREELSRKG